MNNPIISPWVIYLIDVASCLGGITRGAFGLAMAFVIIGAIIYAIWRFVEYDEDFDEDAKKSETYFKALKKGAIIALALVVANALIPTKETAYTMLVASYATEENVEKATDAIKSGVDYIFEKLDGGVSE
jgi:hypothetical protein